MDEELRQGLGDTAKKDGRSFVEMIAKLAQDEDQHERRRPWLEERKEWGKWSAPSETVTTALLMLAALLLLLQGKCHKEAVKC